MKKFIAIYLLLLLLTSCNEEVTFDKPQPADSKALNSFPASIQGTYIKRDESECLNIGNTIISQIYNQDFKVPHGTIDTNVYLLLHDSLINKQTGAVQIVKYIGDTLITHVNGTDTMFVISDSCVLKKDKGYYFLNWQINRKYWSVMNLSFTKGMLIIGSVRDSMDIKALKTLSESTEDSTGIHFKPTQKQFEKFIKQNGFRERDTFYRASNR
jgi:hypothetical protein